jgi:hypothetical protein
LNSGLQILNDFEKNLQDKNPGLFHDFSMIENKSDELAES